MRGKSGAHGTEVVRMGQKWCAWDRSGKAYRIWGWNNSSGKKKAFEDLGVGGGLH